MEKYLQISKWFLALIVSMSMGISLRPVMQNKSVDTHPVIVLSPGHGWWSLESKQIDPGAINGDLIEKDINLEVARDTQKYLSRCSV